MSLKLSSSSKTQNNGTKKSLKDLRYIKTFIRVGELLHKIVKASLSADDIREAFSNFVDDFTYTQVIENSDLSFEDCLQILPVGDCLQVLKIDAQLANKTQISSRERQDIKKLLNTLYSDIQTDKSLSDDERQGFLKTISEIQDII